ncbi:CAMP-RESPONSE ELEMENT BINDING PROTEIN-RELATED [Salix purpurea]|uniref:cAMP-RESPONSE ELEMENT BINDING PROTEIN-RELATED n=1 Tax=Salix purpurea TaxID=77065 RepID=A0A9Q1A6S2_SALPP|nr:CAMP-RESPONSE ELEMENT BINDING PROTEIN-RELATED [Salix purpurea]KAJ6759947.1 CAMP-RESPONSE ELEMENT BINDING PROTEIN-RELATED [Salix purpurea]
MQRMVSENIAYGNAIQESPVLQPLDHQDQTSKDTPFSPFDGQSSLLSLTLNEIQIKRGKSFGSMNMDEFLANLWNSDDNQVPSQPSQNARPANDHGGVTKQCPKLARQGSFSIPTPLCKKTVDEVWFEIQNEEPQLHISSRIGADHEPPQRQQTLGEITLEDFLVKAGVVQEAPAGSSQQKKVTPNQDRNNACLDINFGMGLGYQNLSAGNGFVAYQVFPQDKLGFNVGEAGPNNARNEKCQSIIMELGAQSNKKRMNDGPPEVVVERRQRRMIKNRESAARSRARKQAYTVELEHELNQLKQENAKLKQIVEEIEEKRKDEVMKRKSSKTTEKKDDKLRSIRRTVSLAW